MASLVPIDPKGITAQYHGFGRKLVLHAEGTIPGYFLTPFFEQDIWEGGLRFSVKAYSGGFGKLPKDKDVVFDLELPILLPIPHFNNKSVLVETAFGTSKIIIDYKEWLAPPQNLELAGQAAGGGNASSEDADKKSSQNTIILPPIEHYLIKDGFLPIPARIPKEISSWLKIEFNKEFIKLVDTKFEEGTLIWDIAWVKVPSGPSDPQRVNVITTIKSDILPPILPPLPGITKIIQPYLVYGMYSLSADKE
ncbi:hypothetical protein BKA60DRAFT_655045 [Fusarium oxysporum]|uniref:Uncharacterized protein n=1 Tax=Fusarium oxysporum TaxID=5507 RepID=A0A420NGQ3_FUSOX|nr:hypothetical protein BKA60DRAFT_655045 [Fusarium oxysporum]RKK79472.1 hypothetical protein BFJ69_g4900 [Fusarium oxysporum]